MNQVADAVSPTFGMHRDVTPLDIQEEVAAYMPPIPKRGSRVAWFRNAQRNGPGLLGFVQEVSHSGTTVDIWVPANSYQGLAHVRHMSDPHLKIEAHRKESGGWDFSQEWYEEQERLTKIETAIKSLESIVTQLAAAANTATAKRAKEA